MSKRGTLSPEEVHALLELVKEFTEEEEEEETQEENVVSEKSVKKSKD